jgi:hypothetical protein
MNLQADFESTLLHDGFFAALWSLNMTTRYRFTGVYRFEPGLVKSVVLCDRETPDLRVGEDVPWFDSYCMMTAENGTACEIQNSLMDARLTGHAARRKVLSYCAVLLRTPGGDPLGTLCHYDVCPQETAPGTFEGLRECCAVVERYLWSNGASQRQQNVSPQSDDARVF